MKRYLVIFAFGLLFSAQAQSEFMLSKSVFVHVAEPNTLEFQKNEFAYFPAGTRLYKGDEHKNHLGARRQLVFSEYGIAAYIKSGMFWNSEDIQRLRNEGGDKWVFITRQKDVIAEISDKVRLVIGFSRGEKYPLVEEEEDSFSIKVGKNKIPGLGDSVNYQVIIPRKHGKLVNLSKGLSPEEAATFKLSVVDGVSGIKKPCNTTTAIATKYGGSASGEVGFSLKKFWLGLTAKGEVRAETETSKLEEFDKNMNVSRKYYTRSHQPGIYKLTRYKSCGGNQDISYIYTSKDIDEVTVSKELVQDTPVAIDKRTSQVLISCPKQYFAYYDELIEWEFDHEEIPFIISSTAKFKAIANSKCLQP
ncbi:hypothetical protein [Candidatus Thiosymbion oneisti]|uniref:hypothetical protein n=1 Tax=Candidatus Thiosymbion oneisti TaxID=589554 RepID=UPI000B7CEF20|nr:hypothetical protein [Candidatus Thiosymbion oneisti]